ncbi:hypothetical protein E1264_24535 [Actinomadura sp. KC216]|uniref:hypothetical protein n=1 Tax=Actinomadura sp. KC216 TaxID=2530370 RepID=UPI00104D7F88|nr:hypothetical protein [Actinomadura sp. KC216]TDB84484.1 hypothetical protein E1264_24535 [Actinomadura sp. KC216]
MEINPSDARVIVTALRSRARRMTEAADKATHPSGAKVALEAAERCRRIADTIADTAARSAGEGAVR